MNPITPRDETAIPLSKPKDWDDNKGECITLNVVPITYGGNEAFASLWQPSEVEVKQISAGYPIVLIVVGRAHPPVAVAVANHRDRITEITP